MICKNSYLKLLTLLVLILTIGNTFGQNEIYPNLCGLKFKDRIVGGIDSLENSWPWVVSIHFNFEHACGGTLVNRRWIVTAAHCLYSKSVAAYKVILGAHNITGLGVGTNAVRRSVTKMIVHESYKGIQSFDVGLLKLDKDVEYSQNIFPACISSKEDNYEGKVCYFAGWGLTYSNGKVQMTLREIPLSVMPLDQCKIKAPQLNEQKYCTGKENVAQDTCQGDSGGGMMCQKSDGKWYLSGIVSYGVGACGNVGFNARIDYFRDWIDDKIRNN